MDLRTNRRELVRRGALLAAGAGFGWSASSVADDLTGRDLPISGGAACATIASRQAHPGRGQLTVTWGVETDRPLVALTFDDGPRPQWTERVLDTLDAYDVPATFFLVGRRVSAYPQVLRGRMGRHEAANHSWNHNDLAEVDADNALDDLARAHEAITRVTGQEPALFRPPYGHLGGAAVLAANRMAYDLVLWSLQMVESEFPGDPAGHARHIVEQTRAGTILLAHDVGNADRLVAIDGLPQMVTGLRARGFAFVTVSELVRASAQAV